MSVSQTTHQSVTEAEKFPLSFNQEFLCVFDKGETEGAFGHRHTLVNAWRLFGELDLETLQAALDDVVERHETLRSTISRDSEPHYQQVGQAGPVKVVVHDLSGTEAAARDTRAEEFLDEIEAGTFDVRELPLLRAAVGRFDDQDSVLVLSTHHTATDGWSMQVIIRDLAACYASRRSGTPAELPAHEQYRELASWQQRSAAAAAAKPLEYWRDKLKGGQLLGLPTDRPKSAAEPTVYSVLRFVIGAEVTAATVKLAKATRSSPFMVVVAAYNLLLNSITGTSDIVLPTFTSGRNQERFQNSVGPFFNFVPLRTDLSGLDNFRSLVLRTRQTCVEAYSNEVPFALIVNEVPELGSAFAADDLAVAAFEFLQFPAPIDGEAVGELRYAELRKRLRSQPVSSDIPDGLLWALDLLPSGEIVGSLKYNRALLDPDTVAETVSQFCRLLGESVAAPDAALKLA